jgi:transposase
MYFRTKTIKTTPLVQLIESYRNAQGKPRQRVIVSLGDAQLPAGEEKMIARMVECRLRGDADLFEAELSGEGAAWVTRIVQLAERSKATRPSIPCSPVLDGVLIDQVETENVVGFGAELVALEAWDELGLTKVLEELDMPKKQISTAKLMIANRLIEPLSEWALIEWAERTALPELLDLRITKTTKDRLYRTSDALLGHREMIEKKLRDTERTLFSSRRKLVLYDVTNTHFEGLCESNPKAKHGKNKQKRNDCRQVAVGMAFDEQGNALAHEVFEGNMADTSTLKHILARLDQLEVGEKPVVVLDAGFASAANLALLKELGYAYLINVTRGSRTKYADAFSEEDFIPIPGRSTEKQVEVKTIPDPDDPSQNLILCRSQQRQLKEVAMVSNAEIRFLADAQALQTRIEKGHLKKPHLIDQKIGRLQKTHPKVNRFYTVERRDTGLHIQRDDEKMEEALELCGSYVLKTDQTVDPVTLWELYMSLLKAESGFRILKSSLGLRPNHHQLEERVDGHIFISILAYHLLNWIRQKLERSGDHREWNTIRRILRTHCLVSTRLPLNDGRIINIRKPSKPDAEQARIYTALGIDWKSGYTPQRSEISM